MPVIDRKSILWNYLTSDLLELINDGEVLLEHVQGDHLVRKITDYSFLVFPFAKAYEGFLKKLFLDVGLIQYDDYYGDSIRIGRILNPHYQHEAENIFSKISKKSKAPEDLSEKMWGIWIKGRNLIFHYFPHNYKRLSYTEAADIINEIVHIMEESIVACELDKKTVTTIKN